jgi:hypothetical protein
MDVDEPFEYVSKAEAQALYEHDESSVTTTFDDNSIVLVNKNRDTPPSEYDPLMEDVESLSSDDTESLDPIDGRVDPDVMLSSTNAVFAMMETVVRQIDRIREENPMSTLGGVEKKCYSLFDQTC